MTCAFIWVLSTLNESSPIRFEKLSLQVYGQSSMVDEKEFLFGIINGLELIRFII